MEKDKERKTNNAPIPKIGKALRVGSAKDADELTSKKMLETEENGDNYNNSLVGRLPLKDKIIIIVACIRQFGISK